MEDNDKEFDGQAIYVRSSLWSYKQVYIKKSHDQLLLLRSIGLENIKADEEIIPNSYQNFTKIKITIR